MIYLNEVKNKYPNVLGLTEEACADTRRFSAGEYNWPKCADLGMERHFRRLGVFAEPFPLC